MTFTSRTILITGGTAGIGLALAERLIDSGNRVIVCGRNPDRLDQCRERLPSVTALRCDITDTSQLDELRAVMAARFPDLDTLVNNAGVQYRMDLTDNGVDDDAIDREIHANLNAHINLTRRLYPLLSANRKPIIAFTGSALGRVPRADVPVYSAAKAGLASFVESLRRQSRPDGFRIVEIVPDLVATGMTRDRDQSGMMSADDAAAAVLSGLAAGKNIIFLGRTARLNRLRRAMPEIAARLINRGAIPGDAGGPLNREER